MAHARATGLVRWCCVVLAAMLLAACGGGSGGGNAGAFRTDRQGWIFVHVAGAPRQRGRDYGRLVAPEIDDFITTLKAYLLHNTQQDWDFYRQAAQQIFVPKLDAEYRAELEGIAEGVQAAGYPYDFVDLVAENGYFELSDYYLPSIGITYDDMTSPRGFIRPPMRCSAFIATGDWTADHNVVMAHNSWDDYIMGQRWNVILDIVPASGERLLMQTAPGFIHSGTDFDVNGAGIVISETTIGNFAGFDVDGLPEFMRARKAAQYSKSLDDFVELMSTGDNGGYANSWLVGDTRTGEIGKLELGLVNIAFYRSFNGFYDGENYVDDAKMIRDECSPTLWITEQNFPYELANANCVTARRLRWYALMEQYKGQVDVDLGMQFEADQYEQALGEINPGGYVIMARMEISDIPEVPGVAAPRPFGANEAKVIDSTLAGQLSFWARMGHPDGSPFDWGPFFVQYPQFAWQAPYLRNLVTNQWTQFNGQGPLTVGFSTEHPATAARGGPPRVSGYTIDRMTSKGAESIVHYVRH